MFCKNCGTAVNIDGQFCQSCGAKKDGLGAAVTPDVRAVGNSYSTVAIILGAISLWVFPIVFGPIALVLGAVAKSRKEPKATTAIVIAACGTIFGMIFGALAWGSF